MKNSTEILKITCMNGERIIESITQEEMHTFISSRREFPKDSLGIFFEVDGERTSTFINPELCEDFGIDRYFEDLEFLNTEDPRLSSDFLPELLLHLPRFGERLLGKYIEFRDEQLSGSEDVTDDIAMLDAFWEWYPYHKEDC